MRIWQRLLLTLVLAPILWRLVMVYVANQGGEPAADLWQASAGLLGKAYLVYTIPALVVLLLLVAMEGILRRVGLDLLIAALAPMLAAVVAVGAMALVNDPRSPEGLLGLFIAYGLVWGLSIRGPREQSQRANLAR